MTINFFMKMGNNLETIYMEGQGHIFTIDLIFLGQHAMLRGPAFSEQYFVSLVVYVYPTYVCSEFLVSIEYTHSSAFFSSNM